MRIQQFRRAGFTMVEVVITLAIMGLIMSVALVSVSKNTRQLQSVAEGTAKDAKALEMLEVIRQQLAAAQGETPVATLTADLSSEGTASLQLSSTFGFPDTGRLVIGRGTATEERLQYLSFDENLDQLTNLIRGQQCSTGSAHVAGTEVVWGGLATPIDNQVDPTVDQYDGQVREFSGTFFYAGDGSGFSFRVPVDPAGGGDFFTDGQIQLGAQVNGADTLDGWSALYYSPTASISEADTRDINEDGDTDDVFDLGSIRMRSWDSTDEGVPANDVRLCPSVILQEQCAWGSDLDGNGFQDPLFFWDPGMRRLHIRLFVLSGNNYSGARVKAVESVVFLRNSSPE